MDHIITTALAAGAQKSCVQNQTQGFAPVLRRDLLRAVRQCRSELGLSTGDVLVLDTLLSFLPCRDPATGADRPITPSTMLIVYASNKTICERANGMNDRVLRRHVSRLCEVGLLARRDSATGKRFPLRSSGRVASAYGLDLSPLLLAAGRLAKLAEDVEQEKQEKRTLRAEALTLRADILRRATALGDETAALVERMKTVLRRSSLGLEDLRAILSDLAVINASMTVSYPENPAKDCVPDNISPDTDQSSKRRFDTAKESAGNGPNVRQVETPKTDTNLPRLHDIDRVWEECPEIASLFPTPPTSTTRLREIMQTMAACVGIEGEVLANGLRVLGWADLLRAMDKLAQQALTIGSPQAWLSAVIRNKRCEEVGHGQHSFASACQVQPATV